jgi:GxxExxY protein
MLRLKSALTAEEDLIISQTIGAALAVHRELGPGYLEGIYHKAMRVELRKRDVAFETERRVEVRYRGELLGTHHVDLIIQGLVVVELKSIERLDAVHRNQVVAYLKSTKLRAGLLINFNVALLKQGIKRIVL